LSPIRRNSVLDELRVKRLTVFSFFSIVSLLSTLLNLSTVDRSRYHFYALIGVFFHDGFETVLRATVHVGPQMQSIAMSSDDFLRWKQLS